MKKYISVLVLFLGIFAFGQVPRFAKYDVAETGAQLYLPLVPTWEKSLSEDRSEIYLTSVIFGEVEYGAIIIRLAEETAKTNQNPESLMESYVHFLNDNVFKFTKKTDFGKGHTLQNQPDVKGILEYAETEDGTKYTVKSWTNPSMIAVMYVASKKEVNINFQEIYFNGFRFKK